MIKDKIPTLQYVNNTQMDDPGKKWEAEADLRSKSLHQRKVFMMQEARKRYLQK
jgi:hypothetical protein